MLKLLRYLPCCLLFFASIASATERYPFQDPDKRQQFYHLITQFRCLVCQNQDLASSNSALADDLRSQIYYLVRQGKSNKMVSDYMQARYGEFILFSPPWRWQTVLLWLGPFLLLGVGVLVLFFVMRKARLNRSC